MRISTIWTKHLLTACLLGMAAAWAASSFTFTVDGKIDKHNQQGKTAYVFSEQALMALPQHDRHVDELDAESGLHRPAPVRHPEDRRRARHADRVPLHRRIRSRSPCPTPIATA